MESNDMQKICKAVDDGMTILEHERIIRDYCRLDYLDREEAIEKYQNFNLKHPEYLAMIQVNKALGGNTALLENMDNAHIVENLKMQLMYLSGRNLVDGIKPLTDN